MRRKYPDEKPIYSSPPPPDAFDNEEEETDWSDLDAKEQLEEENEAHGE